MKMKLLISFFLFAFLSRSMSQRVAVTESCESKDTKAILELSANECFFGPTGRLQCVENLSARGTGTDFNRNYVFTHITGWSSINDTIIWGLNLSRSGDIFFTPVMGIPDQQAKSALRLFLESETETLSDSITLNSTGNYSSFQEQSRVKFTVQSAGKYLLKLVLKSKVSGGNVGDLQYVYVDGPAAKQAEIIRRRWRPLAVHTSWSSSSAAQNVILSVHQNTIISTGVDMYQPITTPFGYTGSTWDPKSQTFNVYNFSLWSFSANSSEPPVEQLSHLIAVGKGLSFGNFSHEGTGVKPRGPSPFIGANTNQQVIAVRMEPGIPYNTFYSYYLDPRTDHWAFYGCGKTFNKKNEIEYLTTGAFIEVVGPPAKSRSGHRLREVQFRGWQMTEDSSWHKIDRMKREENDAVLSYKNFGVSENGNFIMQMGGMSLKPSSSGTINRKDSTAFPFFLENDMLPELFDLPAKFTCKGIDSITSSSARISIDVSKLGAESSAMIYWGLKEGLTFYELWENSKSIELKEGTNFVRLENLMPGEKYYFRVRIINREGITWLRDTQTFTTIVTDLPKQGIQSDKLRLFQNFPNPFNPSTNIEFYVSREARVELSIYNSLGELIDTLISKELSKGMHSVCWNGKDSRGNTAASGLYFYRLTTPQNSITKKMMFFQ